MEREQKQKWIWLLIIIAAAAASLYYRFLVNNQLEQTSALFIGIPALIAAICVLTPKPESATGTAVKSVTLFIGISGILLGEGFICILMAAPLFYLVAVIIGELRDKKRGQMLSCVAILLALPMSSEGTRPALSFAREEVVSVEHVVAASPQQVETALSSAPRLNGAFPLYLRLGFPRPVSATISGTAPGDTYRIHFAGGEGKPGDLVLQVAEHRSGMMSFRAVSDTSHVAHWLKWERSTVEWQIGRAHV